MNDALENSRKTSKKISLTSAILVNLQAVGLQLYKMCNPALKFTSEFSQISQNKFSVEQLLEVVPRKKYCKKVFFRKKFRKIHTINTISI